MSIGKNIADKRKALGITQEQLAKRMGYKNKTSITKIESGVNDIAQSKVVQFAEVLGTTVAYLMGWEDEYGNEIIEEPSDWAGELSDEERELIEAFRMIKPEERRIVLSMIRAAVSSQK